MGEALTAASGLAKDLYVSPVGAPGARILAAEDPLEERL
jgi:hypothetical protein